VLYRALHPLTEPRLKGYEAGLRLECTRPHKLIVTQMLTLPNLHSFKVQDFEKQALRYTLLYGPRRNALAGQDRLGCYPQILNLDLGWDEITTLEELPVIMAAFPNLKSLRALIQPGIDSKELARVQHPFSSSLHTLDLRYAPRCTKANASISPADFTNFTGLRSLHVPV
jgi:hypothetical protein